MEYNGQQLSYYDATQRQRGIERNIRRWKREYTMLEAAGEDTTEAAAKLAKWRAVEKDFCKQTGLPRDNTRTQVHGFGRSQASRAVWESKRTIADPSKISIYSREKYNIMLKSAHHYFAEDANNSLPFASEPNSVADIFRLDNTVKQRRIYGPDGRALIDYDTDDHGKPKFHPTGAHKHEYNYSKEKPHGKACPLSEYDLKYNQDIIQEGENYHAPKTEKSN